MTSSASPALPQSGTVAGVAGLFPRGDAPFPDVPGAAGGASARAGDRPLPPTALRHVAETDSDSDGHLLSAPEHPEEAFAEKSLWRGGPGEAF